MPPSHADRDDDALQRLTVDQGDEFVRRSIGIRERRIQRQSTPPLKDLRCVRLPVKGVVKRLMDGFAKQRFVQRAQSLPLLLNHLRLIDRKVVDREAHDDGAVAFDEARDARLIFVRPRRDWFAAFQDFGELLAVGNRR